MKENHRVSETVAERTDRSAWRRESPKVSSTIMIVLSRRTSTTDRIRVVERSWLRSQLRGTFPRRGLVREFALLAVAGLLAVLTIGTIFRGGHEIRRSRAGLVPELLSKFLGFLLALLIIVILIAWYLRSLGLP